MVLGENNYLKLSYAHPLKVLIIFILQIIIPLSLYAQLKTTAKKLVYWSPTRTYVYEVSYFNEAGLLLSKENLTLQPTGVDWELDDKQTLVNFEIDYSKTDSTLFGEKLQNGKKMVRHSRFQEGAIEKESGVWMHPLRQNQYCLTEVAPFPEVKFPFVTNKTWSNWLEIYQGWEKFEGRVNNTYTVKGREARNYSCGTLNCWKTEAVGLHNKLGESKATFYFNTDIGFTEMNYVFYNQYRLNIVLTNYSIN